MDEKEMKAQTERKLWEEFEKVRFLPEESKPFIEARNNLVVFYYDILEAISKKLSKKLKLSPGEILSYGYDGLVDAIKSFDKSRDVKFKTWANYRIRGSVIDNIRKSDWVPRLVRQRFTKLEEARNRLESACGLDYSEESLAEEMELSFEEFLKIKDKSIPIAQVSMNAKPQGEESDSYDEFGDIAAEAFSFDPIIPMIHREMWKKLMGKHFTLPEQKIMILHYSEGYTMKEVADAVGFSESRISQMHADILRRLRKKVERNPVYAEDLLKVLSQ